MLINSHLVGFGARQVSYTLGTTNIASSATFTSTGTPLYGTTTYSELSDGSKSDNINHGVVWSFARNTMVAAGSSVIADFGDGNDKRLGQWDLYAHSGRGIEAWSIDYSDNGSDWTAVATLDATAAGATTDSITWAEAGAHRYWRMLASSNGPDANGAGASEIEVYEYE